MNQIKPSQAVELIRGHLLAPQDECEIIDGSIRVAIVSMAGSSGRRMAYLRWTQGRPIQLNTKAPQGRALVVGLELNALARAAQVWSVLADIDPVSGIEDRPGQ